MRKQKRLAGKADKNVYLFIWYSIMETNFKDLSYQVSFLFEYNISFSTL